MELHSEGWVDVRECIELRAPTRSSSPTPLKHETDDSIQDTPHTVTIKYKQHGKLVLQDQERHRKGVAFICKKENLEFLVRAAS
uniref:Uncharacterized protein n=1 Tax=Solanum lycopersicum TaxID=4081 RepID=A0A3Q7H6W7_SOLLC